MPNGTVYDLKPGCLYRVRKEFTDYHGGHFVEGTVLTYRDFNFVPYHGGYTVHFEERNIYLQEYENANVLQDMWSYLEA